MSSVTKVQMSPALVAYKKKESRNEVQEYYLPFVGRLCDHDLLAELNYWHEKVAKRGFPYKEGTIQERFIQKMRKLQLSFERRHLSSQERKNAIAACIALRGRIVPLHPVKAEVKKQIPAVLRKLRQQALCFDSDWELIQKLATHVGSYNLDKSELNFISSNWKESWFKGRDGFEFSSVPDRVRAELLLVDIPVREYELCLDQVELFKARVGFRSVPIWQTSPVQVELFV